MPFYIFMCSHSEASSTTTLCLCCLACSSTWAALLWCLVQALAKPVDTCLRFTTVALHNLKQWDFCFRQGTLYSTYPWVTTEMIVSLNKLITLTSGISMSWLNMLRHFTTKKICFWLLHTQYSSMFDGRKNVRSDCCFNPFGWCES